MSPVALLKEQPAEGVLHCARHLRKDMRLHGGQMNDVRPDEPLGNPDSVRIDFVEHQHLGLRLVVNPLLALLVQMDVAQAVFVDQHLLVLVR